MDAIDEMIDAKEETVVRHDANVKCEQNKEFLKGNIFGFKWCIFGVWNVEIFAFEIKYFSVWNKILFWFEIK